jgi:hypothetical protein
MNSNAAANAMNALNTITGVGERFGFDPVGMKFAAESIGRPLNGCVLLTGL